jgi:hypothetical protein
MSDYAWQGLRRYGVLRDTVTLAGMPRTLTRASQWS